jgi:uncharacterized protein YpmB
MKSKCAFKAVIAITMLILAIIAAAIILINLSKNTTEDENRKGYIDCGPA